MKLQDPQGRHPPWQANLNAAMEELIKGQQQATSLFSLLKDLFSSENGPDSAGLLVEVVASFSKALSFLELEKASKPRPSLINSSNYSDTNATHRHNSCLKKKIPAPRRSGYRRRTHPYVCRTVFVTKVDDGYTWRKYGQKDIYGAKHPRSYYRCVHKHDQGCQVTRQVQKTEEDPSIFAIIYMGEHTCTQLKNTPNDDQRTANCDTSLESNIVGANDDQNPEITGPLSSTLIPPTLKQECEEEVMSSNSTGSSSSSDLAKSQDLAAASAAAEAALEQAPVLPVLSSDLMRDVRSSNSMLEIDHFTSDAFKFEDLFQFNQDVVYAAF